VSLALADVYGGSGITNEFARRLDGLSASSLNMLNRSVLKRESVFQVKTSSLVNRFIEMLLSTLSIIRLNCLHELLKIGLGSLSSDSLLRRRFSLRLRAELHELINSAEKRNATVVGISRTLNSNAKNGSVKKKLIDNIDSKTASSPGPVPPNQVASSTAGKKRETRTPNSCSGNVTAVQIATDKIERPYR